MRKTTFPLGALVLALCFAGPAAAGVWSKTGPNTLLFEGVIRLGDYDGFALVFGPAIREIVVNSEGGVTSEAIRIGHAIAAGDIKVTVVEKCLSSCANYFFVAGRRREIRGGVVGYHGNVAACFTGAFRDKVIAGWKERYNMSEEDIRRNLAEMDREMSEEARLLRIMGVSQELFDRTCVDDKGMGDGGEYAFLLPTRLTFEKYGLWGIVGEQDPAVMKSLPWAYVLD
ncbi:MAG: hypothetical protein Q8T11_13505 [Elusimicrobiota bacterium]|nr:hypothetical protein [Elusimicrobiota bacterium]